MDEIEFRKCLEGHNLTIPEVCGMIEIHTGAIIAPKHVRTAFDKYGSLSQPLTAAFRLLFKVLGHGRETK